MACEDCSNYNPMSAEDGYCDRKGMVVDWNDECVLEYNDDFDEDDSDYELSKHSYDFSREEWTTSKEFIEGLNKHDYKTKWTKVEFDSKEEPEEYNQYCLDILNKDDKVVIGSMFTFWNDYDGDGKYKLEIDGFNSDLYEHSYLILEATTPNEAMTECDEILKHFIFGLNTIKCKN